MKQVFIRYLLLCFSCIISFFIRANEKVNTKELIPEIETVTPSTAILGQEITFTITGKNLTNQMVYYIPDFGSGTVEYSASTIVKTFKVTSVYNTGVKYGEIKDQSGGSILYNFSVNVSFPTPDNFTGVAMSSSQVELNWDIVNDAFDYEVYLSTSGNGQYELIKTTRNNRMIDDRLSSNTNYYYKIKACQASNDNSCSELTNYIEVKTFGESGLPIIYQVYPTLLQRPDKTVLGTEEKFFIKGENLRNDLVYFIENFGNGSVENSVDNTEKVFYATSSFSTGLKNGEIKDRNGGTILYKFKVEVVYPAPFGIATEVINSSEIQLEVAAIDGFDHIEIYRSLEENDNYQLIYHGESLEYRDRGLIENTTYYYKAKICQSSNEESCSDFSLVYNATTQENNSDCIFSNIEPTDWYYDAVQDLCNRGLIDDDGEADPEITINRAELAKLTYLSIELGNNPIANSYPSPFVDLQDESVWYHSFAKNLAYLEFNDGVSPFDKNFNFYPSKAISRAHVLKVLLEAWNIDETQNSGNNPYTDVPSNHEAYNYILKARDLGIIDNGTSFRPNENTIRAEVFVMLHRLLTVYPQPIPIITDADFYRSGNYTPQNLNNFSGMHSGNFNHYTKTSFGIASVGIPLIFSHTYNSYLVDMPSELTPIQPLGKMWSHSFNSYIQEFEADAAFPEYYRVGITLPNGGFQIYKKQGVNYVPETEGIYDELEKVSSTQYTLTTKSQIVYTFLKYSNTADAPYVLTQIRDRNNNTLTITYESAQTSNFGRIKEVIGTAGRKLRFLYHTGTDLLARVTDPSGRDINFVYDNEGYLRTYTNPKNLNTHYHYGTGEEKEFLKRITLPKGNVINNTYENKKLRSTKTNGNTPTQYTYDSGYKTTITDPTGKTARITYNDLGNPIKIEQATSTTLLTYNSITHKNYPTQINYNEQGSIVVYDDRGNITRSTLPMGIVQQYEYNEKNDLERYTDAKGNVYSYQYNTNGNLTKVITPRGETTFAVNAQGLVTRVTNPENIAVGFVYDNYGNVIQTNAPEGITSRATYDLLSRLTSNTNPNGRTITYQYDANDNLLREVFNGQATNYEFDHNDNLIKIINAKQKATTLAYDTDDDTLSSVNFGEATDRYTYYDDGSIKTYTNPKGVVFTYTYDDQNLLKTVTGGGTFIEYNYDNLNRVDAVTNENGTIAFTYDELNRIIQTRDYYGNTIQYTYDKNSNVTRIRYPDGKQVIYEYCDDNLLRSVVDWNNKTTSYNYRDDGLLERVLYPNGTHCKYLYDGAGRMVAKTWKKSDNTIINAYSFHLDDLGNHIQEIKTEPFTVNPIQEELISYTYNDTNRLLTANSTMFAYDRNGNTTTKGGTQYSYDVYDRLVGVSKAGYSAEYKYDAFGNRREKTVNGTVQHFVLDILGLSRVLVETDQNGNYQNYYVYGLGLISRTDTNNTTHYYHDDFRGSVIAMTDASEELTHKYAYDDFGKVLQIEEANFNPYRYVGVYGIQYEEEDLYFMRARYYNPNVGRFLTEDPIWATNLYPYAGNNPVMNIDSSGKMYEPILYYNKQVLLIGSYSFIHNKLNSDFSKDMFDNYWFSRGDVNLTEEEFIDIVRTSKITDSQKPIRRIQSDGNIIITRVHDFYNTKYDLAFGNATIVYNEDNKPIGFYDEYDFNWNCLFCSDNDRSIGSELKTRGVSIIGDIKGASSFKIKYGIQFK
ncbi:RHS repeat-associated core domain-containing protein [Aquimarina rhabdastrellae]